MESPQGDRLTMVPRVTLASMPGKAINAWEKEMPANKYDLVVIGSGVTARAAASKCRGAGWSVAMVDHQPFGGTCALRGCDPKRVLIGAAETVDLARRLSGKGIRTDGIEID